MRVVCRADINECLLNNGHGPCQDTCRNLVGGYECSCEGLQDASLSADNHTCEHDKHTGPCSVNNAGCSHTCLSTMGRVFCLCPDGFMLEDDWKTCQGERINQTRDVVLAGNLISLFVICSNNPRGDNLIFRNAESDLWHFTAVRADSHNES